MDLHRAKRGIDGALVLFTVFLAVIFSYWWLLLTFLVGVNLFQSAFTNSCPMTWILDKIGFKSGASTS